jgi:cation:H+ antiporter
MLVASLLILVSCLILFAGAELLVRGGASIALKLGLTPLVVGLTVVAFGTSAPELIVSLKAAWIGQSDIAIGNVVGSNIANVLLVLGLSAVVGGGLVVAQRIVRIDVPIMLGVSVLLFLFALDGELVRWEGAVLFAGVVAYTAWTVRQARRDRDAGGDAEVAVEAEYEEALDPTDLRSSSPWVDLAYVVGGLVLLVVGASALVEAATDIASSLGVSELVIGLTVVAVGTSLPEIATSVLAAMRGQRDIAVGNVIGSNIFNILAVLGLSGLLSPSSIPVADGALSIDIPIMIAVALACLPIFANGFALKRWEGILFLLYYAAYVIWLILDSADHAARDAYVVTVLGFVIPLTVITFVVIAYRERRTPAPA